MVGAKYYLFHLERAIGTDSHPDRTLQSFRTRIQQIISEYEALCGEVDPTELENLVVMSSNTPERILTGETFENSGRRYSNLPKIESTLSRFVSQYMWDETS
jgi:hypothetical protein